MEDAYVDMKTAAQMLECSRQTVLRIIAHGKLKVRARGGAGTIYRPVLVSVASIRKYAKPTVPA